jgi:hypothetical protein
MATLSQTATARPMKTFAGPRGLVDQYFYFVMSLLFPVIVVAGFSHTVSESLFHPVILRPRILWFHAVVFSGWIVFYMFQSVLVRTRNVKWHRFFGWFGTALGTVMVPLGVATAIAMGRFDRNQLHQSDAEASLIVPLADIAVFGTLLALAIVWRKKPELHRRMVFIATCGLLGAAFARFDFLYYHGLDLFCIDLLIGLGIVRDLLVNRRIHCVYWVAWPVLIALHGVVTFIWRSEAAWWVRIAHSLLG